jgi:hypothetical protein
MTNQHATLIRNATENLLKATLAFARTDNAEHYNSMIYWQNELWQHAKDIAASEEAEMAE